jgi:hypothetical protein
MIFAERLEEQWGERGIKLLLRSYLFETGSLIISCRSFVEESNPF